MPDLTYRLAASAEIAVEGDLTMTLAPNETVAFDLASGGAWYGHGFAHRQPYPLNHEAIVAERFAVNNIQSPIWMCSSGCAILTDTDEVLRVAINEANSAELQITSPNCSVTIRVFTGFNLPAAWSKLMTAVNWPPRVPDATWFGHSVFCTWTQFPRCITQGRVVEFARSERANGYPCSTITIDDRWESGFGELEFAADFPDPEGMVTG